VNPLAARAVTALTRFASGLFTVLGTLGLVRGHFTDFVAHKGVPLISLRASPLTNLVMLALGLIGIAMATHLDTSRRYALWVGVIGVVWGLIELVVRDTSADIFGRDGGLAALTVGVGIAGLAVWAWSRPGLGPEPAARHDLPS
jgi:Domain of unknown function (DUF4383)